ENRGFVRRVESGAAGRRTGLRLTPTGRRTAEGAVLRHGDNIRRHFLDRLSADQAATLRAWSSQMAGRD
ncbi:MAG TPA: MarR family transcriptional regulator, partial [Lentzea sp.]